MPLIGGRWRPTRRDPYRRQILGVRKPPPTCTRCGKPTGGAARCEPDCQPRVATRGDGTDG